MFCFNIPRPIPTEAANIVFFQIQCLCRDDLLLVVFLAWTFNRKISSPFLDVLVLFWGGELTGKLQMNDFSLRKKLSSRMGCSRVLTRAHALLTLCSRFVSRFAHAFLRICSRFSHACSFRFLLSPYEVPFGSLRGSELLTLCSRLLTLCSRFAHAFGSWCVYFDEETHKQTMSTFLLFRAMCT